MRISDFLLLTSVDANLSASSKPGMVRELVGLILQSHPDLDPNLLVDALLRREKLQSTGIGDGVAVPHGKVDGIKQVVACLGRSTAGIDYQSLDGAPTQLFFTLVVPMSEQGMHLKALARVSRILKNTEVRKALLEAEDAAAMFAVVMAEDAKL